MTTPTSNLHPLDRLVKARCIFYRKNNEKPIFELNTVVTFSDLLFRRGYFKLVIFHINRFNKLGIEVQIEDNVHDIRYPL